MTVVTELPTRRSSLVSRAIAILLHPDAEWTRIDLEPATPTGLLRGYVAVLAAIGPVCGAIGALVFGHGIFVRVRPPLASVLVGAAAAYALAILSVVLLALVIDALAPVFEGRADRVQAFKVAAYSGSAAWLAGIFGLVPQLALLSVAGLYSLYLLYRGLPRLMRTPADKALPYAVVIILVAAVLSVVPGVLVAPVIQLADAYAGR